MELESDWFFYLFLHDQILCMFMYVYVCLCMFMYLDVFLCICMYVYVSSVFLFTWIATNEMCLCIIHKVFLYRAATRFQEVTQHGRQWPVTIRLKTNNFLTTTHHIVPANIRHENYTSYSICEHTSWRLHVI